MGYVSPLDFEDTSDGNLAFSFWTNSSYFFESNAPSFLIRPNQVRPAHAVKQDSNGSLLDSFIQEMFAFGICNPRIWKNYQTVYESVAPSLLIRPNQVQPSHAVNPVQTDLYSIHSSKKCSCLGSVILESGKTTKPFTRALLPHSLSVPARYNPPT